MLMNNDTDVSFVLRGWKLMSVVDGFQMINFDMNT